MLIDFFITYNYITNTMDALKFIVLVWISINLSELLNLPVNPESQTTLSF
jgi:hypothetical protein